MNLNFIPINGKSEHFDYESFELSIKESLQNTCKDATILLFNNFPVLLSTESSIDLILVVALKNYQGNYFRVKKGEKWIYLHNLIIPINFITNLQEAEIKIDEDSQLIADNETADYSHEIQSIKFGLIDYLVRRCNFIKEQLFISPLIFIQNKQTLAKDSFLVADKFDFKNLLFYLKSTSQEIFCSYTYWKSEIGYSQLPLNIEEINNQASKDSIVGFLTKKKIDRLSKQLSNEKLIFNDLNKNLIIVLGKAGTGKSSELILLMMRCISNGQNTLFLTYNRLLIYDIARTIKSYVNSKVIKRKPDEKIGEAPVTTLHSFFFRLSKSLGVLHVLSEKRKGDLLSNLNSRATTIGLFLQKILNSKVSKTINSKDIDTYKEIIQNNTDFEIPIKEVGIDFMNFLKSRSIGSIEKPDEIVKQFIKYKESLMDKIVDDLFLSDYYGVLENTLLAINKPEEYFSKYNIENKYELLEVVLKLSEKHLKVGEEENLIDKKAFTEKINRKVGGCKRKRTLFIDEAQDCHTREKEILISIYGSDNIVISSGGKEQLIRHVELCNWEVSSQKKINVKKYKTSNKSFRIKKSILDFCNFIATKFSIELALEALETEDEGELILDFRKNQSNQDIKNIFANLILKGEISGCTAYESILVLIDSHSKNNPKDDNSISTKGKINEYDNIEDSYSMKKGNWNYKSYLEKENSLMFWDGTNDNKSQMQVPFPTETRLIFYDSCRGLEAWGVACFNIDKFFIQKMEDPDAEKFLINDEKELGFQSLFLTNDDRKRMFAGTWVLMALTRAIDTLYLKFANPESELGKLVMEYAKTNPKNTKILL